MYYILLTLAVFGIVATFSVGKLYQKRVPSTFLWAMIKSIVLALVGALIYWLVLGCGGKVQFTPLSLWCGLGMAVAVLLSTAVCFFAYCKGGVGIFTVFQMAGGMLIPYVYGAIRGNALSVWNILGIVLILCGLGLSICSQLRQIRCSELQLSPGYLLLCLAIFVLNGAVSTISYYYGNHPSKPALSPFMLARTLLGAAITLPLVALAFWRVHKQEGSAGAPPVTAEKRARPSGAVVIGCLLAIAVIDALSYFLQMMSTPHLPAVAIYPFVAGGTIVLTALAGRIFFGERMDRLSLISTVLIAPATLLFLF